MNHAARTVISPYGWLLLEFDEERPLTVEGPKDARIYFEDCMSTITGPHGITLAWMGSIPTRWVSAIGPSLA